MGEIDAKQHNFLNSEVLEIREYEIKIAEKCSDRNSLVVIPTGLGKTIIAVLVAGNILKKVPLESKIICLAPTRPLINQHYETFLKFLTIPEDKFTVLTGKVSPKKRAELFHQNQIIFYTPQTLRNDLVKKKYSLKNTALIIFDEAHHTSGDYPYTMISDEYLDQNPDGIVLGLTASPGASKTKIALLCESLHIPLNNIHIRTRQDEDVKNYVKAMHIYKIGVNLTDLMKRIHLKLKDLLEERLQYLSEMDLINVKKGPFYNKIFRKDILRLNSHLTDKTNNHETNGIYTTLSINAQALILFHMLELLEQQGLDVLLTYIEKLFKESMKPNSSKASRVLVSDYRLGEIYQNLKSYSIKELFHPKYPILLKLLLDEFKNNPSARILIFIKLRESVKNIVLKLKETEIIKPIRFVGQATKSPKDKGLSQKKQIEILEQFKQGKYNTLVSTNIGEEGLDIAECDVVIFYDIVASEIRLIQRKGRTARHKEGKVIMLYTRETNDEKYLQIALAKLRKMNKNLKSSEQIEESFTSPIYPISQENNNEGPKESLIKKIHIPIREIHKKDVRKKQNQTKLQEFYGTNIEEESIIKEEDNKCYSVHVSKDFPMKFGLRKRLQQEGIDFKIVDSDLHMTLHNKALIQIYSPKNIDFENLLNEIHDFKKICSLPIIIFDFLDFFEEIEGEKRLLKREITNFASKNQLQIISIDNEEELFFIIKNIFQGINKIE